MAKFAPTPPTGGEGYYAPLSSISLRGAIGVLFSILLYLLSLSPSSICLLGGREAVVFPGGAATSQDQKWPDVRSTIVNIGSRGCAKTRQGRKSQHDRKQDKSSSNWHLDSPRFRKFRRRPWEIAPYRPSSPKPSGVREQ